MALSKKRFFHNPIFLLSIVFILLGTGACINRQLHPSRLSFNGLEFEHPRPEMMVLPNGMTLYLMEDHEIPLVTINALIRTGSIYEPADRVGLAQLTGEVMRSGGAGDMTPDEIDRKLEFMGAIIETSIDSESGSATLSVMKKDLDEGLRIFSHILREPAFSQEKLEIAKMGMIESIRRQNDEPLSIASREFKKRLYGDDPRGRAKTMEGVKGIERSDLIEFHDAFFTPEHIILGLSGDFVKSEMIDAILKSFGDWERSKKALPPAPIPKTVYNRVIVYAQKPLPQSTILLGQMCCPKNHPDYFAMEVLNFILGDGGFNSRLMRDIRSDRGLAYSVGSFYRGDIDYGVFGAYAMTKSETTALVIDLILEKIEELMEKGVTQEELSWAKNSIINNYIFSFASTAGLVKSYIGLEYDSLPSDFLEKYPEHISQLGLEDIKAVAQKYLRPEDSIISVVGESVRFDRPLDTFGQIEYADLTIR